MRSLAGDGPVWIAARVTRGASGQVAVTVVDDHPDACGPGEYVWLERRGDTYVEVGEFGREVELG